jgi:hypothetical protein
MNRYVRPVPRSAARFVLALLLLALALGCGRPAADAVASPPSEPPVVTGIVLDTKDPVASRGPGPAKTQSQVLHIRHAVAGGESEAVFHVESSAPVVVKDASGELRHASFGDVKKGDQISIWGSSSNLESWPARGGVAEVVLVE